jgi:23S rRNA pseudouridine1911/1915/1917 synthase
MKSIEFISTQSGRLDRILTAYIKQSRNQVEQLIKEGLVKVNGKFVRKAGYKVLDGDRVEYFLVEPKPKEALDVDFDIDILYEDESILVINKPSKLIVHPAPSVRDATLVDWLIRNGFSLSTLAGEHRNGIVHRLDRDTTGVMVVAKTNEAHQNLSDQLRDRSMGRYYLALIDYPLKENLVVDKPIARNPKNRFKMGIVSRGKDAKSAFAKVLEGRDGIELILAKLYSGRTHQIRVHLSSIGRHILGDVLYGFKSKQDTINRVMLHAYKLYLIHPIKKKRMEFIAPLFSDMREFIYSNFNQGEVNEKINPDIIDSYFSNVSYWVQSKQYDNL